MKKRSVLEYTLLEYTLNDVKSIIGKWLYIIEDDKIIDVILGAAIANKLESDPTWLIKKFNNNCKYLK